MIKLDIDEQTAWFLTYLLDECLRGVYRNDLFKTNDNSLDNSESFDDYFFNHIEEFANYLDKKRGF